MNTFELAGQRFTPAGEIDTANKYNAELIEHSRRLLNVDRTDEQREAQKETLRRRGRNLRRVGVAGIVIPTQTSLSATANFSIPSSGYFFRYLRNGDQRLPRLVFGEAKMPLQRGKINGK